MKLELANAIDLFFAPTYCNTKSLSMDSMMTTSLPTPMYSITTLSFGNKFHYGTDLPHQMYLDIMMKISFFQPVTRHWNEAYLTPVRNATPRGTRLSRYLHRPSSTWGRVAQKMEEAHTIAWGTNYNPSAPFDNGWGSDNTPPSPPAQKKQKVEHKEESSDDSNVEPKTS
jgi:hypothetical protein